MIYKGAFNIVGISMIVLLTFLQFKLLSLGIFIRQRNTGLIKNGWSGRLWVKDLKKLNKTINDEESKQAINVFIRYSTIRWLILIGGFLLLIFIAYTNSILNGS